LLVSIGVDDVVGLSDFPYSVGVVGMFGQFFYSFLDVLVEHGKGIHFHSLLQDLLSQALLGRSLNSHFVLL
jgi:hypothetical protein